MDDADKLRQRVIETKWGPMTMTIVDHEVVLFETNPGDPQAAKHLAWQFGKYCYHVRVKVAVKDDGRVIGKGRWNDEDINVENPALAHWALDVRRTDKKYWKQRTGGKPIHVKLAKLLLPVLVPIIRGLAAERAMVGAKHLDSLVLDNLEKAARYRENAQKCVVDAAHCQALAEQLRERHAWAVETVVEAKVDVQGAV